MLVRYTAKCWNDHRSRCIFIPDGADAADESGYAGSLLPSFVSPLRIQDGSLTVVATPSPDRFLSSFLCFRHLFRASFSFATSKPVLFRTIQGIFRHTGVRPNAVIHHHVLWRTANPSRSNVIAKPTAISFLAAPHFAALYLHSTNIRVNSTVYSSKVFLLEANPIARFKRDYSNRYMYLYNVCVNSFQL